MIDLYERHFAEASDRYEESVALAREVGDPWLLSLAFFNLGKARRGLGDTRRACEIFAESIAAFQRLDDPYDLAEVLEDVAVIAAETDPARGLELLASADRLRADIGAARPAAREAERQAISRRRARPWGPRPRLPRSIWALCATRTGPLSWPLRSARRKQEPLSPDRRFAHVPCSP